MEALPGGGVVSGVAPAASDAVSATAQAYARVVSTDVALDFVRVVLFQFGVSLAVDLVERAPNERRSRRYGRTGTMRRTKTLLAGAIMRIVTPTLTQKKK